VRYEASMRRETQSDHRNDDRRDRLSVRVGAVMDEISALLRERRSDEVIRAREVLAGAYHCAAEQRRSRRAASSSAPEASGAGKLRHS
jgi:hypothetical protein